MLSKEKSGSSEAIGQSAGRALDIIDCFTNENAELAVSDVAALLNITPSTASRLLATLESRGYVMRDARRGKYRLGLAAIALGGLATGQMELRNRAWQHVRELADLTGCTANLGVKYRDKVLYLITVFATSSKAMRGKDVPGRQLPLYCTAMGKVLLAALPDATLDSELASMKLVAHTTNTLTTVDALKDEILLARRQGFAYDREEEMLGSNCLAAPVRADNNVIAAVSLSAPTHLVGLDRFDTLKEPLLDCAYHLSLSLRP
jgi:IclR family transcriptional regulator, KDG regulon repressor